MMKNAKMANKDKMDNSAGLIYMVCASPTGFIHKSVGFILQKAHIKTATTISLEISKWRTCCQAEGCLFSRITRYTPLEHIKNLLKNNKTNELKSNDRFGLKPHLNSEKSGKNKQGQKGQCLFGFYCIFLQTTT